MIRIMIKEKIAFNDKGEFHIDFSTKFMGKVFKESSKGYQEIQTKGGRTACKDQEGPKEETNRELKAIQKSSLSFDQNKGNFGLLSFIGEVRN